MSVEIVFNNKDLRDYIFSYIYSFEKLLELDYVYAFEIHKNNKLFTRWISDYTMNDVVEYENIKLLNWLHNNNYNCTEYAMDIAASKGNIEILNFLHNNRNEGCSIDAFLYAIEENQIETIKWLHDNRLNDITRESYKYGIDITINNGNLKLTQYLYTIYCDRFNNKNPFSYNVICNAINSGNLLLIEWLSSVCNYYSYREILLSAKHGNLDILK